jgi:hypothetical protein
MACVLIDKTNCGDMISSYGHGGTAANTADYPRLAPEYSNSGLSWLCKSRRDRLIDPSISNFSSLACGTQASLGPTCAVLTQILTEGFLAPRAITRLPMGANADTD